MCLGRPRIEAAHPSKHHRVVDRSPTIVVDALKLLNRRVNDTAEVVGIITFVCSTVNGDESVGARAEDNLLASD